MANKTARPHQKQNKQTDNDQSSTYIVHGAIFGLDVVKVKKEKHVPARKKKQKPIIKEKGNRHISLGYCRIRCAAS